CLTASVLRLSQLTGLPDRDCLQRSLLLYRVLSRAGAEPTLVVGFDRIDGRILGHARVTTDGHAVIEREADLLRFSPTFSFGTRGALLLQPTLNTPPAKPSNFHQATGNCGLIERLAQRTRKSTKFTLHVTKCLLNYGARYIRASLK